MIRLIDADALREALMVFRDNSHVMIAVRMLDAAPTIMCETCKWGCKSTLKGCGCSLWHAKEASDA